MTFMTKSLSLAAVLAASVSSAALASDDSLFTGAGSDVSTETQLTNKEVVELQEGVVSTETAEAIDADGSMMLKDWTYAEVASSLDNKSATSADIGAVNGGTEIYTTALTDLKEGDPEIADEQLNTAIEGAYAELSSLRDMIGANPSFAAAIEANGYSADDVIGVYQASNGGMAVLIDNRS